MNREVTAQVEVRVVYDYKCSVGDFDGRGGRNEQLEIFKRRGQFKSVSPRVKIFFAQETIELAASNVAQIFQLVGKFSVNQLLEVREVRRKKFRQAKFRQADASANFEFVRLRMKISCQRAVNFVARACKKRELILHRREDFFQREAVNFSGQVFREVNFVSLRGEFADNFVRQKNSSVKFFRARQQIPAVPKPYCNTCTAAGR